MAKVQISDKELEEIRRDLSLTTPLKFIDAGGYKAVYKTTINGIDEAIKILPMIGTEDDEIDENIKRIKREISILQTCQSDYLVKLASICPKLITAVGKSFVVYSEEFLTGESLAVRILRRHIPDTAEIIMLMLSGLDVIRHLWGADSKIIHRDIKPNNVLFTGNTKRPFVILDLGIAFVLGETGITRNTVNIPGTLYYMAPEMLKRGFRQNIDFRVDLYSLALTAYEYASLVNPFARKGDVVYTTMTRIAKNKPEPLETFRSDLPKELCELINKMLSKAPYLRPSNLDILEELLRGLR